MVVLTELLPRSSSSSDYGHRYDVFLSFRGVDTRNSFTDHLYNALLDASISTFLDDTEIQTGEGLKPELESAIKSSRASIIVLSQNYASSTWCLDELLLILEQKRNFNQFVIPIFYHVDPSDVRKQESSFGEALAKHTQRLESETDAEKRDERAQKIELWKMALTQIADLKGVDAQGRRETVLIEEVVTRIHRSLGVPKSNTLPLLIGMDYHIDLLTSWLTDGSSQAANIVSVVGMGGMGKTTLAKYVFQLHSRRFPKSSFIESINTRCNEHFKGLLDSQKQLHADISKVNPLLVNDVSVYTSKIENALARERVLIVLDDIGTIDQLDALLGNKGLHPGSKVIITTRDASLTERCSLFNLKVQPEHTLVLLNGLYEFGSLELFCFHAFKSNGSVKEGYEDVSKVLVKCCQGHPLTLEVLGKTLYKRDVAFWEDCIKALKKEPHSSIKHALKRSVDSMPSKNDKELFKHIACFFVGTDRDVTETILNACDIDTNSGIKTLIDRCLLSIGCNNKLMMHPLIQEMGKDLVRRESPHPWKRSRLWCHEESFNVLKQEKGNRDLLGLALDMRMLDKKKLRGSFELKTKSLSHMDNLMLLQLNHVQMNGSYEDFPEELRWLCMHGSPLKSIPLDLPMENLVALDMSYSNIESFGVSYSSQQLTGKRQKVTRSCSEDKRFLGSLKILDLSFCQHLHSVGGFWGLPALERLIVRECISLIEVCESIEHCVELIHIDLSCCYKLKKVPISISKLKKVKTLLLDGCDFVESQIERWDMDSLNNSVNSQTSSVPSDLKSLTVFLPSSLKVLSLANSKLLTESFPLDFSSLSMLEELSLSYNPIVSMPNCLRSLPRLQGLSMDYCDQLISIEHPPCTLKVLSISSYKPSLRKIKFDLEMSPLRLTDWELSSDSSTEIDGMVKIQAMASVEKTVLDSLGWTNIEFIKECHLKTPPLYGEGSTEYIEAEMYYEFGIFSTIFEGIEMPDWIEYRTEGPCISFTVPSSSTKLRGFNFCCVETYAHNAFKIPTIRISNITKNHTWIYRHCIDELWVGEKGCLSLLSHWMFGENEIKGGDHITVDVAHHDDYRYRGQVTRQCGIGLLYDEEDGRTEEEDEEEDVLGYYKSWNHIIGGDLSAFQINTGEYILNIREFFRHSSIPYGEYHPFIDNEACFNENGVAFKAFSQKKSDHPSHLFIEEVE